MKDLGAKHLAGGEGVQLFGLLNFYLEQEQRYQPREKGLILMEATPENDNTLCSRLRNAKVEDLRSLTNFFGSGTETFVLVVFSKARPSVLALCLLNLEIETIKSVELLEILLLVKKHLKLSDTEFFYWRELVSKCLAEYSSPRCCKPDLKKLVWIVSRRTAQNLHSSYYSVPELPTIPEGGCFDGSESEDSGEDMSCGEESLSSSPPSDQECTFFFDFQVAQTLCFPP